MAALGKIFQVRFTPIGLFMLVETLPVGKKQVGSISKMLLKMKLFLSSKTQSLTQMPFSTTMLSAVIGTLCMDNIDNTSVTFFLHQNSTKGYSNH